MKQNRLNLFQKKLSVLLIALFLTAVPGFIAAMNLGTQLGKLQTKLVGLKGKLGQLKGSLEILKSELDGSGGLTVNSGLGVLPWVQVPDVSELNDLIAKLPPKPSITLQAAVKPTQSAITALRNILSSPNSTIAEKTIIAELNFIKTKKDSAIQELPRFEKNLEIDKFLDPINRDLLAKKPISKLNIMQKNNLEKLKNLFTDQQQYNELTTLLNNISDDSGRTNASNYIKNLRNILVTQNPNMAKNKLIQLRDTPLPELQQQELAKYSSFAEKLRDDTNFPTLVTYKDTFATIVTISEALEKKIGAGATGDGTETPDAIKKKMIDRLKDTKLEIKTDNIEDLASLFIITPAQIKDPSDREKTAKAVFDGFIDSQIIKDKNGNIIKQKQADSRQYLAKVIVRLNLDIFIKFENFKKKTRASQNEAKFNEKFDSKIGTLNVNWYGYFKEKVDTVIASINPTGKNLKNVYSWVKDLRKNKPTQTSHVGLSEEEKEKRAGFLRGLINTFTAANIIIDAKTLSDNMAGIDKLKPDEKTDLKEKILASTTKTDFDKIKTTLTRANLSTILKRLSVTDEEITNRGLVPPVEKPSGPKKPSPGAGGSGGDPAGGGGGNPAPDTATAKTALQNLLNSKRPAGPPPPPKPGEPNIDNWGTLTEADIDTVIANRNVITEKPPIHFALKAFIKRQEANFLARGADGVDVLKKLGLAP